MFRICSQVLHYQQNTIAYAGGLDPELLLLLDPHVLLVQRHAVLEDLHAVFNDHVLDSLLVNPGDVRLDEGYLVTINLLDLHVGVAESLPQRIQLNLGQLNHEGVGYNFAEYELVVAIDEQESKKMKDACNLRSVCLFGVVNLFQQLVERQLRRLQRVVRLELITCRIPQDIVQQKF